MEESILTVEEYLAIMYSEHSVKVVCYYKNEIKRGDRRWYNCESGCSGYDSKLTGCKNDIDKNEGVPEKR